MNHRYKVSKQQEKYHLTKYIWEDDKWTHLCTNAYAQRSEAETEGDKWIDKTIKEDNRKD